MARLTKSVRSERLRRGRSRAALLKKVQAVPQETVHVAVIVRQEIQWLSLFIPSNRDNRDGTGGGWECFLGTDRDQVIKRALAAVRRWGPEKYQVWVGTISAHVEIPVNFKIVEGL